MTISKENHEVELRVLLEENDQQKIIDKLQEIGSILKLETKISDRYFCLESAKSFDEVEMDEVGSFSLRLRQTASSTLKNCELNIKVITNYGDHHAWEEHEVEVNSFEEMSHILKRLGYKIFIEIEKVRTTYGYKNISVNIEDINDFGLAIEYEIITSKENTENAKEEIMKLMDIMEVPRSKIVPKSITNMLMKQKAKF